MSGLTPVAVAREAGTSKQGVYQAIRRGVLRRGPDGLIDPGVEPNKSWLALHARGMDWRGRFMATYVTGPKAPKSADNSTKLDLSDEALDAYMKKGLAELQRTSMSDAEIDALARATADSLAEAPRGALFSDAELDEIVRGVANRIELEPSPIDQSFLRRGCRE